MSTIYLIVGESGSGKTTVVEKLQDLYGFSSIQSYTTRPKRKENETGHTFVTNDEFYQLTDFVGYTIFDGNKYCATSEQVENNDLYVIDPAGIRYFKEHYNGNKKVVVIYLYVPMSMRAFYMNKRGDKESEILSRLVNDAEAFKDVAEFADIIIDNIDIEDTVLQIAEMISADKERDKK